MEGCYILRLTPNCSKIRISNVQQAEKRGTRRNFIDEYDEIAVESVLREETRVWKNSVYVNQDNE